MTASRPISSPVLVLGAALALLHVPSGLPAPFYPLYQRAFDVGPTTISMLFATYILGVVLALVLAPRVAFFRYVLVYCCALSVVGNLVLLQPGSILEVYLGHLIHGLVLGVVTVVVPVVLGRIDFSGESKIAGRMTTSANAVGLTAGPLWAGFVLAYVPSGDTAVWWIQIVMTLLVMPFLRLDLDRDAAPVTGSMAPVARWTRLFRDPLTLAAALMGIVAFASGGLLAALGTVLTDSVMQESNAAIQGFVVSLCFAVSAVTGAIHLRRSDATTMLVGLACVALGVLGLALAILLADLTLFLAAAAVCGVGQGFGLQGATQAVAHRSSADEASRSISAFFLMSYAGTVSASFGVGLAIAASDLVTASVAFCLATAGVCVLAAAVALRSRAVQAAS